MQNNQFYNFTSKCDKCLACLYYQYDCQGSDNIKKVNRCEAYENDPKAYVRQDRDDTYKEPKRQKINPKFNKYYKLDINKLYYSIDLQRNIKFVDNLVVKCIATYNNQFYFGNIINISETYDDIETNNEITFLKEDIINEYKFKKMPLIYMDFSYIG
jgi:hypothetical protein